MTPATHYQHSGKAPAAGILITLTGGLIAGVVLGLIYGFLIYWSPFVYINAFVTFGFGVAIAGVVGALGVAGKIRNVAILSAIALVVSLVGYYVHWAVWVARFTATDIVSVATSPGPLWEVVVSVNALGPWSIFGWTPAGVALWIIWGIEAFVIVGFGTMSARGWIDLPFCERTGQWTTEETLPAHFQPVDINRPADTPQSLLESLQPLDGPSSAFTEVSIATAEGSDLRCVSLKAVAVEKKDDKEQTTRIDVVKNMLFDRSSFERLMSLAKPAAV